MLASFNPTSLDAHTIVDEVLVAIIIGLATLMWGAVRRARDSRAAERAAVATLERNYEDMKDDLASVTATAIDHTKTLEAHGERLDVIDSKLTSNGLDTDNVGDVAKRTEGLVKEVLEQLRGS